MPSLGPLEIIVVGVIALVVFGPQRLPEVARTVGRFISEFKRQADDLTTEFKSGLYDEDDDYADEEEAEDDVSARREVGSDDDEEEADEPVSARREVGSDDDEEEADEPVSARREVGSDDEEDEADDRSRPVAAELTAPEAPASGAAAANGLAPTGSYDDSPTSEHSGGGAETVGATGAGRTESNGENAPSPRRGEAEPTSSPAPRGPDQGDPA